MASIYKRGNFYWGKVQRDGKVHRRSLRTTSKQIAENRLRKWLDELEAIEWGDKPRRLFDDAMEKFVVEHLPTLKPQSARRYVTSLKQLGQMFAGKYLDQINKSALYDYEQMRRLDGVTSTTIRRDLACLSSLLSSANDWDWIEGNIASSYLKSRSKRGLSEGKARTRYLSHKEEAKLLSTATGDLEAIIAVAIDTGLRREELFSLQWFQINLSVGELTTTTDTKNGTARTVPLLPRARQILSQIPRNIRSPYVFCHEDGRRFVQRQRGFQGVVKNANLSNLKFHDLRRTCGCRLLQDEGLSMEEVKEWLGHKSIAVTERSYAFLNIQKVRDRLHKKAEIVPFNKK